MKTIEILVGIPCSGKTTYSSNENCLKISRDAIRIMFFDSPYIYCKKNEDKVTELYNFKLEELLKMRFDRIILDNTHCSEKYIDNIINKYSKDNRIIVKFFNISLLKTHIRNILRYFEQGKNKWIPIKVMNNMYKNYRKINKDKYKDYV